MRFRQEIQELLRKRAVTSNPRQQDCKWIPTTIPPHHAPDRSRSTSDSAGPRKWPAETWPQRTRPRHSRLISSHNHAPSPNLSNHNNLSSHVSPAPSLGHTPNPRLRGSLNSRSRGATSRNRTHRASRQGLFLPCHPRCLPATIPPGDHKGDSLSPRPRDSRNRRRRC